MDSAGIGSSISDFEKVFEDMEVKTNEIDEAMENVYQGTISQDEVTGLLSEIQNENALKNGGMMSGSVGTGQISSASNAQANDVDQMQQRLDQLKNLN